MQKCQYFQTELDDLLYINSLLFGHFFQIFLGYFTHKYNKIPHIIELYDYSYVL